VITSDPEQPAIKAAAMRIDKTGWRCLDEPERRGRSPRYPFPPMHAFCIPVISLSITL